MKKEFDVRNQETTIDGLEQRCGKMVDNATRIGDGIFTGFDELDKLLTGMHGGDIIVVGSRPAMGKTGFVLNIVNYLAIGMNTPCLLYSLEMSKERVEKRLITIGGDGTYERLQALDAPIYIVDDISITPERLCSMAREYKEKYNIGLIVIDYLQLMSSSDKVEPRQQFIADVLKSLKNLARELDVPIVVLSQLSRDLEKREDKRPVLSDLEESGHIRTEADVVMFLYRDAYYNADTTAKTNTVEIIVVKNSNGETGTVELGFGNGRFFERMSP